MRGFAVGEPVFGMTPSNTDGVWAEGDTGGYALAPEFLVGLKPSSLSFMEAGVLSVCGLPVEMALVGHVDRNTTVYIPGGGGGVGHLAIQRARSLGTRLIISSAGRAESPRAGWVRCAASRRPGPAPPHHSPNARRTRRRPPSPPLLGGSSWPTSTDGAPRSSAISTIG